MGEKWVNNFGLEGYNPQVKESSLITQHVELGKEKIKRKGEKKGKGSITEFSLGKIKNLRVRRGFDRKFQATRL